MPSQIGTVDIPTVQNISVESSGESDEIDIVNDDVNLVLQGSESADTVTIEFTLTKNAHPENLSVKEQRDEIKSLEGLEVRNNDLIINGKRGYFSIEEITLPEKGQEQSLIRGSITGKFLPWPKNFPEEGAPTRDAALTSKVEGVGEFVDAQLIVQKLFTGDVQSDLYFGNGTEEYGDDVYGNDIYASEKPKLNIIFYATSDSTYSLSFGNETSLSMILQMVGDANAQFTGTGEVGALGYGNQYGYGYGELVSGYSKGEFGDGLYGDG